MSRGADEGLILCNNLVMSSKETGKKEFRIEEQETPMV